MERVALQAAPRSAGGTRVAAGARFGFLGAQEPCLLLWSEGLRAGLTCVGSSLHAVPVPPARLHPEPVLVNICGHETFAVLWLLQGGLSGWRDTMRCDRDAPGPPPCFSAGTEVWGEAMLPRCKGPLRCGVLPVGRSLPDSVQRGGKRRIRERGRDHPALSIPPGSSPDLLMA